MIKNLARWIGADELLFFVGLGFIVGGLWPIAGMASLIVPGLLITWIALPERRPFVSSPHPNTKEPRHESRQR